MDGRPSPQTQPVGLGMTLEQERAKDDYHSWKRIIKATPCPNDERTAERLWNGALDILGGSEREWKQLLVRDLDNEDQFGREHIEALLTLATNARGRGTSIDWIRPFLLVLTHPALLDCLSVDTFVGSLYNFVAGPHGTRAVHFFQCLCETMVNAHLDSDASDATTVETTLIAATTALREILRREPRARFHDDLPTLATSLENAVQVITGDAQSPVAAIALGQVDEVRAMVRRATGLLLQDAVHGGLPPANVVSSAYPLGLSIPGDRHDNDKADITKIRIFPTREELLSERPDFMPSTDPSQPHFLADQVERHLDTQFRLLRHDTFGELKDVLGGLLHAVESNPTKPGLTLGGFRANQYPGAWVSYVSFDTRRGLEMNLSFPPPSTAGKQSAAERRKWWEDTKRLAEGVLLSFIAVQSGKIQHLFFTVTERHTDPGQDHGLTKSNSRSTVTVKLASQDQATVEAAVGLSCHKARGLMIEFPGILPATFTPILENLQDMLRLSRLPFRQWILPDKSGESRGEETVDVPPPRYARQHGFTFSLRPLLEPGGAPLTIDPVSSLNDPSVIDGLERRTGLDRGQCRALLAALTREFAFIQGPPGTGKTYLGIELMKVLMYCKETTNLGPIVVVCYTNHALDQFLEHLLAVGIKKIVRIGGQSRSALLEDHNLRKVAQSETKTRSEKYLVAKSYKTLESVDAQIKKALGRLHGGKKRDEWSDVQYHLLRHHPRIHAQFRRVDQDGFEAVGRHPLELWAPANAASTTGGAFDEPPIVAADLDPILQRAERDVQSLSEPERCSLLKLWSQEVRNQALDDLFEGVSEADRARQNMTKMHDEVDRRVLQDADVIGITTTGLAKRIATLKRVQCKIVICEEAGEVMEPHMLSALLPAIEHFIQIGDHEQLRPQINNYDLSLESKQGASYQLDRSQFERLSVGEAGRSRIPVAQLNVQRRMRPEISALIRHTIYPRLEDHPSTTTLSDVVGLRDNVFWLDHDHLEEGQHSEVHHRSHANAWEAEMVHALVRHIVRQGVYRSSDIAVLTPYTGQLQALRSRMRNDFEIVVSDRDQEALERYGVDSTVSGHDKHDGRAGHGKTPLQKKMFSELLRIATVDNFQGEEAKVVIVSLVRSNKERRVGFLKTTNRINVLLSRAQHGMYLIGNADTYAKIPMWQQVIEMLRAAESVGSSLGLCCPRHRDTPIYVTEPGDFASMSPEGGCRVACGWRLPDCGHMCQARCHSETMHAVFACPQPCQRLHRPCEHPCQRQTCGEPCGKCRIKLPGVELPCGHSKNDVPCHRAQDPGAIRCDTVVEKTVPKCNHTVKMSCSQDPASAHFQCPSPCLAVLPCGHPCTGTCGTCWSAAESHRPCQTICGRRFGTCSHTCRKPCHGGGDCGLCVSPCEVRCEHSRCMLRCHEACAPCVERCSWSCEHQASCTMPCAAPCDRLPCEQRCSRALLCGHQCPGLCGETCPEGYCHRCSPKQDARVDLLEMKTYAEIDVDETPIVVLGCGHFFTAESLDGLVGLLDVYTTDNLGRCVGLGDISGALASRIPQCPDCQCPVRQYVAQRYNRVVNRAVMDELSKRFLVSGKTELERLEARIDDLHRSLEESRAAVVRVLLPVGESGGSKGAAKLMPERYRTSRKLDSEIAAFLRTVADRHQPAQKLHDAIIHARHARGADSLAGMLQGLSVSDGLPAVARDKRITLGGRLAQTKARCMVLEDQAAIENALKLPAVPDDEVNSTDGSCAGGTKRFLQACHAFISDCSAAKLPKFAVEASLYFARATRILRWTDVNANKQDYVRDAQKLLEEALVHCQQPFQNVDQLRMATEESLKVLGKERYEVVTAEELAAIKQAMVGGPRGIATHSGHWYNCANGHPFAIGECGMPMEQARCPECGEPVGGSNHRAVEGVTRATDMER